MPTADRWLKANRSGLARHWNLSKEGARRRFRLGSATRPGTCCYSSRAESSRLRVRQHFLRNPFAVMTNAQGPSFTNGQGHTTVGRDAAVAAKVRTLFDSPHRRTNALTGELVL